MGDNKDLKTTSKLKGSTNCKYDLEVVMTLVLFICKITSLIDMSYLTVLCPMLILLGIKLVITIIYGIIAINKSEDFIVDIGNFITNIGKITKLSSVSTFIVSYLILCILEIVVIDYKLVTILFVLMILRYISEFISAYGNKADNIDKAKEYINKK